MAGAFTVLLNVIDDTYYVKGNAFDDSVLRQKVAENIWNNCIARSMGDIVVQDEKGWKLALNSLLSDFFFLLGDNGINSLPSILACSEDCGTIQQNSSNDVCQEVYLKRKQLTKSIYSTFEKRHLAVLYLLCGYIQEDYGTEIENDMDNGYRVVANLKNIVNGNDYTQIRKFVPAYIWIKKGMLILQRNCIT